MEKKERNYKVEVLSTYGSCDDSLFKKMAQRGDITAEKVIDSIGKFINITGYAECKITVDDKEFNINYFNTDEGLISSGSDIFFDSVVDYIGEVDSFKIVEIKTKKGKTYKAVPIIKEKINANHETGEIIE